MEMGWEISIKALLQRSLSLVAIGMVVVGLSAYLAIANIRIKTEFLHDLQQQQNVLADVSAAVANVDLFMVQSLYLDNSKFQEELLALADNFLLLFDQFQALALKHRLQRDNTMAQGIKPAIEALRADIVRGVILSRNGNTTEAQALYQDKIIKLLGAIRTFVDDSLSLKQLEIEKSHLVIIKTERFSSIFLLLEALGVLLLVYFGHQRMTHRIVQPLNELTLATDVLARFYCQGVGESGDELANVEYQSRMEQLERLHSITEVNVLANQFTLMAQKVNEAMVALQNVNSDLVDTRDKALMASRAKSEFLANMSHEVRTPLNGVLGMAQLLLNTPLNEQQLGYAHIINDSGQALLVILDDILDYSKAEANKMRLMPMSCDLQQCVNDACAVLTSNAEEKGLLLSFNYASDCPATVIGDPTRIKQVLFNLVGNAIKFTRFGQVDVDVSFDSDDKDSQQMIKITVKDTGIGLTAEAIDKLFIPFSQADYSSTRQFGGTGLGLAISKKLVQLMGGDIGVVSDRNVGSTFWFTLPFEAVTEVETLAESDLAPTTVDVFTADNLNGVVLLVEDTLVNQLVAQTMLEEAGLQVEVAVNGLEAVDQVKQRTFDFILMDCLMPKMDGYAATKAIRILEQSRDKKMPIIALTANALSDSKAACLAAGMDDFISKPFTAETLLGTLKKWAV